MRKTEEKLNGLFDKVCTKGKNCIDCELQDVVEYDNCEKVFYYRLGYDDGQNDALEKQERYRWHDLRKNHNDFPDDGKCVLIQTSLSTYIAVHNKLLKIWSANIYSFEDCEVVAWKEIEPFEEVE